MWNLQKDEESQFWGEYYLNNDECDPVAYDFVFVSDGKAVAVFTAQFYKEGELENMSDAELDKLVSSF